MPSKTRFVWIISIFIVILVIIFAVYRHWQIQQRYIFETNVEQEVLSRAHIGDDREKVIVAMENTDAWFHGTCNEEGMYEDIYVFGPKNKEQAIIWDVFSSEGDDDNVVVFNIGTLSESMAVPKKCSPPEVW